MFTPPTRRLAAAVRGASWVISAWDGERLVGLARGLSDDVSVFYLQDILVAPDWQGQGIGLAMLTAGLARYAHVRQKVLLTDATPATAGFYQALGYRRADEMGLAAYVRLDRHADGGSDGM